jgi:hypothetical protein
VIVRATRYYPPVADSPYAWARHPRVFVELEDGGHAHAFKNRKGLFEVSWRDVLKRRITHFEKIEIDLILRRTK